MQSSTYFFNFCVLKKSIHYVTHPLFQIFHFKINIHILTIPERLTISKLNTSSDSLIINQLPIENWLYPMELRIVTFYMEFTPSTPTPLLPFSPTQTVDSLEGKSFLPPPISCT